MIDATTENAKTLAALMGLDETEAAELLAVDVSVNHDGSPTGVNVAQYVTKLLLRTVRHVGSVERPSVEVVVGNRQAGGARPTVRVLFDGKMIKPLRGR